MKTPKHSLVKTILLAIGVILLTILVFFEFQKRDEKKVQKEKVLVALKQEVENNAQILGIWMEWDQEITVELDTLINKINKDDGYSGRLPIRFLQNEIRTVSTNQTIHAFKNGAWKALLDSGRARDLDIETFHALENLYGSQKRLVDVCKEIPIISLGSSLNRKMTYEDSGYLYKIRILFSKIQLAESHVNSYVKEALDLPEFNNENAD